MQVQVKVKLNATLPVKHSNCEPEGSVVKYVVDECYMISCFQLV